MTTRGTRMTGRQASNRAAAVKRIAIVGPEQRRSMIAEAAYYRAQQRGFTPGGELDDWVLAESEVDGLLTRA